MNCIVFKIAGYGYLVTFLLGCERTPKNEYRLTRVLGRVRDVLHRDMAPYRRGGLGSRQKMLVAFDNSLDSIKRYSWLA